MQTNSTDAAAASAPQLVYAFMSGGTTGEPVAFPELTEREREVAIALCRGQTNREIAAALDVSIKTIDTHRGHVLKKLRLRGNVELCLLAVKRGYIRTEVPAATAEA
jgi:two-component system response regulator NreC